MSIEGTKQDLVVSTEPETEVPPTAPWRRRILSRVPRKISGDDARERKFVQKLDSFLLWVRLGALNYNSVTAD